MGNQRIDRIKDIIRSADAELMEARKRVFPIEYAAALEQLKVEEELTSKATVEETKE